MDFLHDDDDCTPPPSAGNDDVRAATTQLLGVWREAKPPSVDTLVLALRLVRWSRGGGRVPEGLWGGGVEEPEEEEDGEQEKETVRGVLAGVFPGRRASAPGGLFVGGGGGDGEASDAGFSDKLEPFGGRKGRRRATMVCQREVSESGFSDQLVPFDSGGDGNDDDDGFSDSALSDDLIPFEGGGLVRDDYSDAGFSDKLESLGDDARFPVLRDDFSDAGFSDKLEPFDAGEPFGADVTFDRGDGFSDAGFSDRLEPFDGREHFASVEQVQHDDLVSDAGFSDKLEPFEREEMFEREDGGSEAGFSDRLEEVTPANGGGWAAPRRMSSERTHVDQDDEDEEEEEEYGVVDRDAHALLARICMAMITVAIATACEGLDNPFSPAGEELLRYSRLHWSKHLVFWVRRRAAAAVVEEERADKTERLEDSDEEGEVREESLVRERVEEVEMGLDDIEADVTDLIENLTTFALGEEVVEMVFEDDYEEKEGVEEEEEVEEDERLEDIYEEEEEEEERLLEEPPSGSELNWTAILLDAAKHAFNQVTTCDEQLLDSSASSFEALAVQVEHAYHPFAGIINRLLPADILPTSTAPPPSPTLPSSPARPPRRLHPWTLCTEAFTLGTTRLWPAAKKTILSGGGRSTVTLVAVAIIFNHSRRILCPWVGSYVYDSPISELRVALSRPDLFLEENLAIPWSTVWSMYQQRVVFDLAGGLAMALLARPYRHLFPPGPVREAPYAFAAHEATKLAFLVWTMATAEYLFCRLVHAVSTLVAYRGLLRYPSPVRTLLEVYAGAGGLRLPLHAAEIYCGVYHGLFPVVWAAARHAVFALRVGLAALLSAAAGTVWFAIRHRSLAYLPLETAGLFVALGHGVLGALVVAKEVVGERVSGKVGDFVRIGVLGRMRERKA